MNQRPKEQYNKSMKQKVVTLKKTNEINKPVDKLTKRKKTQINKIRDDKGNITSNTNEIQKIIQEYFGNLN
jgi:hypothetical protein